MIKKNYVQKIKKSKTNPNIKCEKFFKKKRS